MEFAGIEKFSLVDYDNHISIILFTAGCNFRCPFCHNSFLVLNPKEAPEIKWDEIMDLLKRRQGRIDGIVVTGGEPTMMPDLKDKLRDIRKFDYDIKLDTNGSHPEIVKQLVEEGLIDYVAMDIKNSKEKYGMTVGRETFDIKPIEETVEFLRANNIDYEFRTTIIDEFHTEEDIEKIGEWLNGSKKIFLQHYIDSEYCISHGLHEVPKEKALIFKAILAKYIDNVSLRGYE